MRSRAQIHYQAHPVFSGVVRVRTQVAAVAQVWRLLPFLALQVPYWAVYAQMSTAFQNQVHYPAATAMHVLAVVAQKQYLVQAFVS